MVNGAGLAMATMDIIKHYGGSPADFLGVGGRDRGAGRECLSHSRGGRLGQSHFGEYLRGIMKCDVIATGIVNAARNLELNVPLVVRLEGTNVEEGKKIHNDSGLALEPADSLSEAGKSSQARRRIRLTK